MMFKVFSMWDEKAKCFLPPFVLPQTGQAVRAVADCVRDPNHQFGKNPHDYALFQVAQWDDSSGLFTAQDMTELVVTGAQLIPREGAVAPSLNVVKK